jgi:Na+-transporting methylmalonyl-CoA/oxaloacetate decarboxylase gamma subunit
MFTGVYIPLVLICLVVIGAGLLVIFQSAGNTAVSQTWASVSLILMIAPFAVISVFTLAILIFAVLGMSKANRNLPMIFRNAANKVTGINEKVQQKVTSLSTPVIKTRASFAGFRRLFTLKKNNVRRF